MLVALGFFTSMITQLEKEVNRKINKRIVKQLHTGIRSNRLWEGSGVREYTLPQQSKVEGITDYGIPVNLKPGDKVVYSIAAPIKEVFGD